MLAFGEPMRDPDGAIVGVRGAAQDITERKQAKAALQESEERYRTLFEYAPDGILIADGDSYYLDANASICRMLGYARDELIGRHASDIVAQAEVTHIGPALDLIKAKADYSREWRFRRKDDSVFPAEVKATVMPDGNLLALISDISERKRADEALRASLREKESLIKEVHHRVKNNLQVITSLLRLEAGRSAQPDTKSVLKEMQNRIRSMALLHESLYRSENLEQVDLPNYITQITTHLFRSMLPERGKIQLHLDLAPLSIALEQAVPCGLLVNELVSNCLKHGFPEGRAGEVRIELGPENGGSQVRLRVSDTGVGLPPDFEAKRALSLGLQLVSDLVRQLKGRLEISGGPGLGTVFEVAFAPKERLV